MRTTRAAASTILLIALLVLAAVAPAGAVGPEDVTGDVTDPTLVSFTVTPAAGDVTSGDATFSVRLHARDDFSGLEEPSVSRMNVARTWSYGINLTRTGTDRDAVWTGTFSIPRGSRPGRYPLQLSISDRVGNGRYYDPEALAAAGHASGVDITNAAPDATPPTIHGITMPATVDVRNGPARFDVSLRLSDSQSGVKGVVMFAVSPLQTHGGAKGPFFQVASGTPLDGTWSGTISLPAHTPSGRWVLEVRVHDELDNERALTARELEAAGLTSGFSVLSDQDAEAPEIRQASMFPIEVNVHDADQEVRVRVRATDALTGVEQPWSESNLHNIQIWGQDLVTGQGSGAGLMARTAGDARDGWYEASFTVKKSSSTGLRPMRVFASDAVGNWRTVEGAQLAAAGAAPALLVYNVPLPPLPIDAIPGDALAKVRWNPPTDDRGAAITEYIVRSSSGHEVRVPGDARSAVVTGLSNGRDHRFEILAVNKAGPSDPSSPLTARPTAGAAAGASGPAPAATTGRASGYRMVAADGAVHAFGAASWAGNAPVGRTSAVDVESTPSGDGYWVADAAGHVFSFGDAPYLGGTPPLAAGETVTSLSRTSSGQGYWLFTTRGRVWAYGDAPFLGDLTGTRLNGPVLDSIPTPSGRGYYLVASDGGVFTFGDATFAGSMGGTRLNAPVQSLVPDPDGGGYWLVASDGGIFAFDAGFHGSMGDVRLNRPVTGMVGSPTGGGYLMVGEDGGIFTFGDVPFHGSLGAAPPPVPVVAVAAR